MTEGPHGPKVSLDPPSSHDSGAAVRRARFAQAAGVSTWMTRLAIISRVFAA